MVLTINVETNFEAAEISMSALPLVQAPPPAFYNAVNLVNTSAATVLL